jgi:outer membrane receptor protein involved in Fe transport
MSGMTEVGTGTPAGTFAFNDVATGRGFGLAALLLGWPTSASTREVNVHARSDYYAAFVQDDWKISRRLTLNLGLRWDMDTPRRERNNRMSGFDPDAINPDPALRAALFTSAETAARSTRIGLTPTTSHPGWDLHGARPAMPQSFEADMD